MRTWNYGAVLALAFAACSGKPASTAKNTGSVNLSISVPGLAGASGSSQALTARRSALTTTTSAAASVKSVVLTYTGPDAVTHTQTITTISNPISQTVSGLLVGSYTFSAQAYASADGTGTAIFSASNVTATVVKNQTASVYLLLQQIGPGGTVTVAAPFVQSIVVSDGAPASGETISLQASVVDVGATNLTYLWTSSCSANVTPADVFSNAASLSSNFTSYCAGTETITFKVTETSTDGGGTSTVLFHLTYTTQGQAAGVQLALQSYPDILTLTYSNGQPAYGVSIDLTATALDQFGGTNDTYAWTSNCGGIFGTPGGLVTTWTAPATSPTAPAPISCRLTLTATDTLTDGTGTHVLSTIGWLDLHVGELTLFGNTVGGSVTGLATGGTVVLQDNGKDDLLVLSNGSFTFATPVVTNATYAVTVKTSPATQACTVTSGDSGTMGSSAVTNVAVTCTSIPAFTVGGTINTLVGTVVLQDNLSDDLSVSASGPFAFAHSIVQGGSYAVSVKTNPATQTCVVQNGSGGPIASDVTNVVVNCTTNAVPTFTVGGNVSGLASGLTVTLANNNTDPLPVSANAGFTFANPIATGATYAVTVQTQPTGQTCTVANGLGTMASAAVTNVVVTCQNNTLLTFTVGGALTGLGTALCNFTATGTSCTPAGASNLSVTLQDNGSDNLPLNSNNAFTFTTPIASGGSYAVTVSTQPGISSSAPNGIQRCTVSNGTGTASGEVSDVTVTCVSTWGGPCDTRDATADPVHCSPDFPICGNQNQVAGNRCTKSCTVDADCLQIAPLQPISNIAAVCTLNKHTCRF
jgi:hypothetical protein